MVSWLTAPACQAATRAVISGASSGLFALEMSVVADGAWVVAGGCGCGWGGRASAQNGVLLCGHVCEFNTS